MDGSSVVKPTILEATYSNSILKIGLYASCAIVAVLLAIVYFSGSADRVMTNDETVRRPNPSTSRPPDDLENVNEGELHEIEDNRKAERQHRQLITQRSSMDASQKRKYFSKLKLQLDKVSEWEKVNISQRLVSPYSNGRIYCGIIIPEPPDDLVTEVREGFDKLYRESHPKAGDEELAVAWNTFATWLGFGSCERLVELEIGEGGAKDASIRVKMLAPGSKPILTETRTAASITAMVPIPGSDERGARFLTLLPEASTADSEP